MSEETQWAICELMGHVKLSGKLTEEEHFGAKMGRVDIPTETPCDCKGMITHCPKCMGFGIVLGFVTQFFGGQSVYRITYVTEAVARQFAKGSRPQPVSPWGFPRELAAAPSAAHNAHEGGHEDQDDNDGIPY